MLRRKTEEKNLFIEKGSHVSFTSGEYHIRCIRGIVWITWPWSGDVILSSGEDISFSMEGMLCMKAFTGANISMRSRKLPPRIKDIPILFICKLFSAVSSYIRNGKHSSVFGDSVHSITR